MLSAEWASTHPLDLLRSLWSGRRVARLTVVLEDDGQLAVSTERIVGRTRIGQPVELARTSDVRDAYTVVAAEIERLSEGLARSLTAVPSEFGAFVEAVADALATRAKARELSSELASLAALPPGST